MVIMHRSGGIAKRLDSDTERKIRDLVKNCKGSEIVLERSGGSFTFEIDVKAENEQQPQQQQPQQQGWSTQNRKPAKAGTRNMEVDAVAGVPSYYDALWEQDYEEVDCTPCGLFFHRH